ncbi:hypothetical protein HRI_000215600 [Hibiscus trionum]|uniref:Uncharacterized protein n=1 Tax=Hibiscus trionum TaxID=183268 RepID=A0A9W7LIK5_HIBTR|nr:hypothetical protein HRI_000215600 [Hibiscus trionum]
MLSATCQCPNDRESSIRELKYHDSGRERSVCPNLGSWNMINKVFRNTLSISIRASRDDKIDQTLLDIYREFAGKNMQILGGAKCI